MTPEFLPVWWDASSDSFSINAMEDFGYLQLDFIRCGRTDNSTTDDDKIKLSSRCHCYLTYLVFFIMLKMTKLITKNRQSNKIESRIESVMAMASPKMKVPHTIAIFSVTSKKLK